MTNAALIDVFLYDIQHHVFFHDEDENTKRVLDKCGRIRTPPIEEAFPKRKVVFQLCSETIFWLQGSYLSFESPRATKVRQNLIVVQLPDLPPKTPFQKD